MSRRFRQSAAHTHSGGATTHPTTTTTTTSQQARIKARAKSNFRTLLANHDGGITRIFNFYSAPLNIRQYRDMDAASRSPFAKPQSFLLDPHAQDHGAAALYESLGFHHHVAFGSNREIALRKWIEDQLCGGGKPKVAGTVTDTGLRSQEKAYTEAFRARVAAAGAHVQGARRESGTALLRSDKM